MKNTGKREKNPELNRGGRVVALILAFLVVLAILPQVRQGNGASSAEPAQSVPVSAVQNEPAETKQEAPRFTVCLDPGHGGNDSGCVSGKRHESDDVLTMAKLVKKYLEQENVQVVLTRTKDKYVELSERAKCANQANADYFVSIHRNLNPLGCGVETWTRADYSKESNALAEAIQKRMVKVGVQQNRGVKHLQLLCPAQDQDARRAHRAGVHRQPEGQPVAGQAQESLCQSHRQGDHSDL